MAWGIAYCEIRLTGPGRKHYRLFCLLENGSTRELRERGFKAPQIVVINGMAEPNATKFTDAEYRKKVRTLGDGHLSKLPRSVVE